jgi:CRP-like cAMP-binding protein
MTQADVTTLLEHLATVSYFAALSPGDRRAVASRAVFHTFEADEVIFLEGQTRSSLWIIEDGSVKISKLNPEGAEYILHLLGPGSIFNDIAALDGGPTPANAIAMTLVSAWSISSEVLREAIERHPAMARAAIETLTGRVRALNRQLEDLALYPVLARLARFLLAQAEDPSLSGPGITRAAIAGHLNTTPETISRVLVKLQDAGAIRFDRHRILITDRDLLRSIAEL